eukprot:TRINITY_DN7582_c0_g1_i1.p1 TRINITY_DN7582_c0_g1~~TRINITY_DN7582_c0_g1_i1.p1  ORF type:complete len:457 (+),score=118.75 TRINITY_DN7582_c0_g1_i1:84-1454(+)
MSARLPASVVASAIAVLEPKERAALEKFKQAAKDAQLDLPHDDWCYVRFLRARNHKIDKALAFYKQTAALREKLRADDFVPGYEATPTAKKAWCHGWFGLDREGHPVYHQAIGNIDPSGLLKAAHPLNILQLELGNGEAANVMYEWLSEHRQELITQTTMIFDLQNLGWKHLNRGFIGLFTSNIDNFETLYPETLKRILIINAPRIFEYALTFVKPFLAEATLGKFVVVRTNPEAVYAKLVEYIEPRYIPERYGGPVPDAETGLSFAGPVDPSDYGYAHFKPRLHASVAKGQPKIEELELAQGDVVKWCVGSQELTDVTVTLTNADNGSTLMASSYSIAQCPATDFYRATASTNVHLQLSSTSSKTKNVSYTITTTPAVDTLKSASYSGLVRWRRRHLPDFEPNLHMYPWYGVHGTAQSTEAGQAQADWNKQATIALQETMAKLLKDVDKIECSAV